MESIEVYPNSKCLTFLSTNLLINPIQLWDNPVCSVWDNDLKYKKITYSWKKINSFTTRFFFSSSEICNKKNKVQNKNLNNFQKNQSKIKNPKLKKINKLVKFKLTTKKLKKKI